MSQPEPRWTAETRAIVLFALSENRPEDRDDELDAARILALLADAGLLLPPGGETREEFGYQYKGFRRQWTKVFPSSRELAARDAEDFRTTFSHSGAEPRVVRRTVISGPWTEVQP